jgi:GT2 family glycosyltransferase
MLRRCLQALDRSEGREQIEIIVADNGSSDGSAQLESEFPNVHFIRLPMNFGLTKALNIAFRASKGEYIFTVHDDTEVEPGCIRALASILDTHPEAGGACPLLLDAVGAPAPQLGSFPPDGIWRPAEPTGPLTAVEYASGAALMFRSFFLKAMRKIDERYGQLGSDAEIAMQIRAAGKKVLLESEARAVHHAAPSPADPALLRADRAVGRAAFIGKYSGFASGLGARIGAVLGALGGFRLGELSHLVSGQKIDGTQARR